MRPIDDIPEDSAQYPRIGRKPIQDVFVPTVRPARATKHTPLHQFLADSSRNFVPSRKSTPRLNTYMIDAAYLPAHASITRSRPPQVLQYSRLRRPEAGKMQAIDVHNAIARIRAMPDNILLAAYSLRSRDSQAMRLLFLPLSVISESLRHLGRMVSAWSSRSSSVRYSLAHGARAGHHRLEAWAKVATPVLVLCLVAVAMLSLPTGPDSPPTPPHPGQSASDGPPQPSAPAPDASTRSTSMPVSTGQTPAIKPVTARRAHSNPRPSSPAPKVPLPAPDSTDVGPLVGGRGSGSTIDLGPVALDPTPTAPPGDYEEALPQPGDTSPVEVPDTEIVDDGDDTPVNLPVPTIPPAPIIESAAPTPPAITVPGKELLILDAPVLTTPEINIPLS